MLILWLMISCMILLASCLVIIACNSKPQHINNALLYDNKECGNLKSCKYKPRIVFVSILFIVIVTVYLYKILGASYELNLAKQLNKDISNTEFHELITDWLEHRPNNETANWIMAKRQMQTNNFATAEAIYRKLLKINPNVSLYWSELGQLLFLANNNIISSEIRKYYLKALEIYPEDITALELQGIDYFAKEQYQQAKQSWEQALANETSIEGRQALKSGILQAKNYLGEPIANIQVCLHIDTTSVKLTENTRAFVFARLPGKNELPVAVETITVNKLPVTVVLSDASISMDSRLLSDIDNVDIIARLSESADVKSYNYEVIINNISTAKKQQLTVTFTKDHKIN